MKASKKSIISYKLVRSRTNVIAIFVCCRRVAVDCLRVGATLSGASLASGGAINSGAYVALGGRQGQWP